MTSGGETRSPAAHAAALRRLAAFYDEHWRAGNEDAMRAAAECRRWADELDFQTLREERETQAKAPRLRL